ncbi:hypothetical protein [Paraburkholderia mimosarum]|uniref:hypothetical protein n=1 Tax=Paraburkholderia mimosarum TaxID=312026 RepID=UPI0012DE7636|nr:hypothetical protein [Paraburkholderia mimosarum]
MNEGSWGSAGNNLRADQIGGYRQQRDNSVDGWIDNSDTNENTNDSDSKATTGATQERSRTARPLAA